MANHATSTPPLPDTTGLRMPRPDHRQLCLLRTAVILARCKRRIFPGHPEQVAQARRFVGHTLGLCPTVEDAVLLTSELATNSIQHTATGHGGTFEVTACHGLDRIRIAVTDGGSAQTPTLTALDDLEIGGQGLRLIAAMATAWGHTGDEHGRTVWFELTCR
jgi:serine/threonine-protein kinase RsbW